MESVLVPTLGGTFLDLFDDLPSESDPEVEELLPGINSARGCSAVLYRKAFKGEQSTQLFETLLKDVDWEQREITVYGKTHPQPRLVAWFGNPGTSYTYAGLTLHPTPWIDPILEIKTVCEAIAGTLFNSVLLNLYRDGDDTVGWHSDDEPELGANPTIASVSLGAARRFDLRHKVTKETVKTLLLPGSVLMMTGRTQAEWVHQVPRTKKVGEARINLTFRQTRQ
jgi:alkylated DNA repair dioxygenase AlkB